MSTGMEDELSARDAIAEAVTESITEEPDSDPRDPIAPKRPSRRTAGTPRILGYKKDAKGAPKQPPKGELAQGMTELYTTIGVVLMPFDSVCGSVLIAAAPECAEKLEDLARQNPAVLRALLALTQTSAWGAVIAAHTPIIMAVAAHHSSYMADLLPDNVTSLFPDEPGAPA